MQCLFRICIPRASTAYWLPGRHVRSCWRRRRKKRRRNSRVVAQQIRLMCSSFSEEHFMSTLQNIMPKVVGVRQCMNLWIYAIKVQNDVESCMADPLSLALLFLRWRSISMASWLSWTCPIDANRSLLPCFHTFSQWCCWCLVTSCLYLYAYMVRAWYWVCYCMLSLHLPVLNHLRSGQPPEALLWIGEG